MILCERVPCKLPWRGLMAAGVLALLALPGWMAAQEPKVSEPAPLSASVSAPALTVASEPAAASLQEPAPSVLVKAPPETAPAMVRRPAAMKLPAAAP